MIRTIDTILALVGIITLLPLMTLIYIIGLLDTGSPLFIQTRIGQYQKTFSLVKFRTMRIGSAQVGTHLASTHDITVFGRFLRKTKLDELPQLFNVVKGEMSLVGPRPGLPTQVELKNERQKRYVLNNKPGITGLAQVNGIDMSTPKKLARYDQLMLRNLDVCLYFQLLLATVTGKGQGDRIKQT